MALTAVPEAQEATVSTQQLPLFESFRPARFQLALTGNVELSLANEDEARMADALRLGRSFVVRIQSSKDDETFLEFDAEVRQRAHKRVRHAEHGDSVVSSARLAITNLEEDEG